MPAEVSTTSATQTSSPINPRSAPSSSLCTAFRDAAARYASSTATANTQIASRGDRVPGAGTIRPLSQVARYQNRPSSAKTLAGVPTPPSAGRARFEGMNMAR